MDTELPDVSILQLDDPGPPGGHLRRILNDVAEPSIPEDIAHATDDRAMVKLKHYLELLPYPVESNTKLQELLDLILLRITQCIEARDYDPGLQQWDSMVT